MGMMPRAGLKTMCATKSESLKRKKRACKHGGFRSGTYHIQTIYNMKYTEAEIKEIAARYPRFIRWSDEDKCFVGSIPDLNGECTSGDTPEEVTSNLAECAELYVETHLKLGFKLPEPRSFVVTPSTYREDGAQGAIQALRRRLGLTQADFARVLGVSKVTICHWEQGLRRPDGASARLLQIAERTPEAVLR